MHYLSLTRRTLLLGTLCIPAIAQANTLERQVYTEQGQRTTLREYAKEGNLLLSVWSYYCSPCIAEIPGVNNFTKRIAVLGLCLMPEQDYVPESAAIKDFRKQRGELDLAFPNVLLYDREKDELLKEAPFTFIPAFILLKNTGEIAYWQQGSILNRQKRIKLEQAIRRLS